MVAEGVWSLSKDRLALGGSQGAEISICKSHFSFF